jgi:hypothetical protein
MTKGHTIHQLPTNPPPAGQEMEQRETLLQKSLVEARQDLADAYQLAQWFAAYLFGGLRTRDFYEAMGNKIISVLETAGTPWPKDRDGNEDRWQRECRAFIDRTRAEACPPLRPNPPPAGQERDET